ncbi:hypothetical protein NECAME_18755 [Necator americanus]|uniref:Uncharacterized protein n=1 Tax=Necator americanus TaxID=51031 RepID=W2SV99_NECAM|nr:hypothetical protein NECAME_18755 [Necator americanus]ETN72627.1 hypothetical protein NECAME_18755 [Necator americanus]
MDFIFHERIRHFIASTPRTFVGVVDAEDPLFISSDDGVQPVESAASGEQLSAHVQVSLAVAVAQCMWEPLTEFSHHSERSQFIAHGEQPDWQQITPHLHMDAAPLDSSVRRTILQSVDQSEALLRLSCFRL